MLILQFFGGLVVSLLASIGVLQTPGPEGLVFPAHLRCTGLLEIGVFQTPMTDGLASREHLMGSPVTRNRWLDDACLMNGIAGMG